MKKGFYIPALLFLLLTLFSGVWLRLQWGWPGWFILRTDFLIHGHSHVALLGWIFLGLSGFILEAGTFRKSLPRRGVLLTGKAITLITTILFIAFVYEGYAPLSIALSTLHMLFGYYIAWIFFRHARHDSNLAGQYFLEGSVFWMVIATAGPWLLAAGSGLSPFWINFAVRFYLHVLFNGWFVFALAGLAWRYLIPAARKSTVWPFWLMMAGLLPSLIPGITGIQMPGIVIMAGMAGSIFYGTGGMAIVWFVIQSELLRNPRWVCRELLWTGLAGAVPVFILPVAMAWPSIREIWLQSHFMVIGFIHLHLLVMVTSFLLFAILQRMVSERILYAKRYRTQSVNSYDIQLAGVGIQMIGPFAGIILRAGTLLYIAGSVAMTGVMFITGIMQVTSIVYLFPVQKILFYTGLTAMSGVILLLISLWRK